MNEMNGRTRSVLCAIVETYIEKPLPVGSRVVTKKYHFNLSPATIRNIMADLEEAGYLAQPHTSAGRIPTDRGYRAYVDSLSGDCQSRSTAGRPDVLGQNFESARSNLAELLGLVTECLSAQSHYLAFAAVVEPDTTTLNRIQLYKYRGKHTVAVILTNEGIIKNRVMATDFGLSQRDLNRLSDYLNSEFSGRSINEIRTRLIRQMSKEKALYDILISKAIDICKEALSFRQEEIFISGFAELLGLPDFTDRVKEIAMAIEDKHHILGLLEELSSPDGVRVVIGEENPIAEMRGLSVIVVPYRQADRPLGSIGIIGPTRMDYSKAISMLEAAAASVSVAITENRG